MPIIQHQVNQHWNFLLALDADLERLSRYIEFDRRNYRCFSLELARILFAAASEVDVIAKQLCVQISAASTAGNIHRYRDEIRDEYPQIVQFGIQAPRFALEMQPWLSWTDKEGVPDWWTGYNKVKHERHNEYAEANLENALNAVAGLFVLVLFLKKQEAEGCGLFPTPQVLKADPAYVNGVTFGGLYSVEIYDLSL